jgi:hypothetical protein
MRTSHKVFSSPARAAEPAPEICVLKRDETEFYADAEFVARAGRLFGVYVFDRTVNVHCCELAPSYECYFVGTQSANQLSEADRELLLEADERTDAVHYWHTQVLDRAPALVCGKLPETALGVIGGLPVTDGRSSAEAIEEQLESCHQNEI